jgi:hypothetical protein
MVVVLKLRLKANFLCGLGGFIDFFKGVSIKNPFLTPPDLFCIKYKFMAAFGIHLLI